MDWSRLGSALLPLWEAGLVWAFLVIPTMAWNAHKLRDPSHPFAPLPRSLLALLWLSDHTWPYTKLARASRAWDAYEQRVSESQAQRQYEQESLALEAEMSLLTGVRTMPSRLDLGLPPRSQAEADAWLAAQTGGPASE